MRRVGVDVGGTFTDLILVDEETGRITVDKVPSTPDDPARGTVAGVQEVCERRRAIELGELDAILHGTTVATNIVLTHTGAEVGMLTTDGFRDILHIARHKRPYNFSLHCELPWQSRPLVRRRHRLTVKERITAPDGEILVPLDEDEVRERVRELKAAGVEAVSVCLLHSYLNPDHERRVAAILAEEFPEAYASISHEVLPLYREYERFSTVCLNAYIGPKVTRYVERFADAMREAGFRRDVQLMQSSGGTVGATAASATARLAPHVRARRRADRRHLGRPHGGPRERHHARHGRHVGRHRRRPRRRAADAPPRRHDGRRLSGDDPDGRRRHDRRRRRLDRLRRPRRDLPRRAAVGGRRSRAGLLRAGRRGADRRPTRSSCSAACAPIAVCSVGACSSTASSPSVRWRRSPTDSA